MDRVLTHSQIDKCIERVASEINRNYYPRPLTVLGVLDGAFMFTSDLVRCLSMPVNIGFIKATSYNGKTSSGEVIVGDPTTDVRGKNILVVEDIVDTGRTIIALDKYLKNLGAVSVIFCAFAVKRIEYEIPIEYKGFLVPSCRFYVGYGMDYDGEYRNLPELYYL